MNANCATIINLLSAAPLQKMEIGALHEQSGLRYSAFVSAANALAAEQVIEVKKSIDSECFVRIK